MLGEVKNNILRNTYITATIDKYLKKLEILHVFISMLFAQAHSHVYLATYVVVEASILLRNPNVKAGEFKHVL